MLLHYSHCGVLDTVLDASFASLHEEKRAGRSVPHVCPLQSTPYEHFSLCMPPLMTGSPNIVVSHRGKERDDSTSTPTSTNEAAPVCAATKAKSQLLSFVGSNDARMPAPITTEDEVRARKFTRAP